jgi:predicted anti-sigma-YlaC factor YlaD
MKEACQRYLEEPEAHAGHLAECEDCRALFDTLGLPVETSAVRVDALPLAAWEGASHRPWPLVMGGALLVLVVAAAVCAWAGVPPLRVVQSSLGALTNARLTIGNAASALREASLVWQVAFGLLVVAVNAVLVLLLRRAPRGIDA